MTANLDAEVRRAREAWELATTRGDAAACLEASRAVMRLCDGGDYALLRLEPRARAEAPIRIVCQRSESCAGCGNGVRQGDSCYWTPGSAVIACVKCGGGK